MRISDWSSDVCSSDLLDALAPLGELDADRAAVLDEHAGGERARPHGEVRPRHRRLQVGDGGAPAAPAMDGPVHVGAVFLLKAVHVLGDRVAGLAARLEPSLEPRDAAGADGHLPRPAPPPTRTP